MAHKSLQLLAIVVTVLLVQVSRASAQPSADVVLRKATDRLQLFDHCSFHSDAILHSEGIPPTVAADSTRLIFDWYVSPTELRATGERQKMRESWHHASKLEFIVSGDLALRIFDTSVNKELVLPGGAQSVMPSFRTDVDTARQDVIRRYFCTMLEGQSGAFGQLNAVEYAATIAAQLSTRTENLDGKPLTVVFGSTLFGELELWLDDDGFLWKTVLATTPESHYDFEGHTMAEYELAGEKLRESTKTLEVTETEFVGGVRVATQGVLEDQTQLDVHDFFSRTEVERTSFQFKPSRPDFSVDLPEGTRVASWGDGEGGYWHDGAVVSGDGVVFAQLATEYTGSVTALFVGLSLGATVALVAGFLVWRRMRHKAG